MSRVGSALALPAPRTALGVLVGAGLVLAACPARAEDANAMLQGLTVHDRNAFMALTIASLGEACVVIRTELKGLYAGNGYWLADCATGDAFMVIVAPDLDTRPKVLDCDVALALGVDCAEEWE